MGIKHKFVSSKPDGADTTVARPSDWNSDHNHVPFRVTWGGTITAGTAPGIVWTNMPASKTTWLHQTSGTLTDDASQAVDLLYATQVRLTCFVQVGGQQASTALGIDYWDGAAWQQLLSLTIGTSTGLKDSGWVALPFGGQIALGRLRLWGQNGNGVVDPRFSPPCAEVR